MIIQMDTTATNTVQGTEAAKFTSGPTAVGTNALRRVPTAASATAMTAARVSTASPPSRSIGEVV